MADVALCPTHPNEPALGDCARCGTFVCAQDSRLIEGQRYCNTCAARPDVDWLEAWRLKHWGVRDGWAWLFGISVPVGVALGIMMLLDPAGRVFGVFSLASAAGGALWWLKRKEGRWVVLGSLASQAVWGTLATGSPAWLLVNLLPFAILLSVITATRTRLFFELEVPREKLKKMWDVYSNNLVARYALSLGILGLIVWPMAPLALVCGLVGFSRVDEKSRPPVGRRGTAIAGIVLGALGIAIGTTALATGWFR